MKLDFTKLVPTAVDGKPIMIEKDGEMIVMTDFHKTLGELLWTLARTLKMRDLANSIYAGELIQIDPETQKEMEELLYDEKQGLKPFAVVWVKEFIELNRPKAK